MRGHAAGPGHGRLCGGWAGGGCVQWGMWARGHSQNREPLWQQVRFLTESVKGGRGQNARHEVREVTMTHLYLRLLRIH